MGWRMGLRTGLRMGWHTSLEIHVFATGRLADVQEPATMSIQKTLAGLLPSWARNTL